MDKFISVIENNSTEIVEKKSKFIANIFYVENTKEIEEIIKKTKKRYHDARHNCIAYRVIEKDNIIEKSSDDGEPSGTAGAPMLSILKKNNLCNVLVIVTRYFGGILLGTGGLVRAYTEATLKVIENTKKTYKVQGIQAKCEIDYNYFDNFKYYCKNNEINIVDSQYLDIILCIIQLEGKKKEKLLEDIQKGKVNIKNLKILNENYINKSVEK